MPDKIEEKGALRAVLVESLGWQSFALSHPVHKMLQHLQRAQIYNGQCRALFAGLLGARNLGKFIHE
jgi:hypothetical protein